MDSAVGTAVVRIGFPVHSVVFLFAEVLGVWFWLPIAEASGNHAAARNAASFPFLHRSAPLRRPTGRHRGGHAALAMASSNLTPRSFPNAQARIMVTLGLLAMCGVWGLGVETGRAGFAGKNGQADAKSVRWLRPNSRFVGPAGPYWSSRLWRNPNPIRSFMRSRR